MSSRLFFRRAALIAFAAPASLALTTGVAQAHYTTVYHGSDLGTVSSSHTGISACDQENDGNAVYTEALLANGTNKKVWDYYGGGCASAYVTSNVRTVRICESGVGCSAWATVSQ